MKFAVKTSKNIIEKEKISKMNEMQLNAKKVDDTKDFKVLEGRGEKTNNTSEDHMGAEKFAVKTSQNRIEKEKISKMNKMQVNAKKVDAQQGARLTESHWEETPPDIPEDRWEKMNSMTIEQARALKYSRICRCIKDQMKWTIMHKSMDDDAKNYFLDTKRMAIRLIDVTAECSSRHKEDFADFIDGLILLVLYHDEKIEYVTDFIRGCLGIRNESCEAVLVNTCDDGE